MPTTRQETVTLYTFDELSGNAKETARQWWRECLGETDLECALEDIDRVAAILGVQQDTRAVRLMSGASRIEPARSYNVGDRGEYFAFSGRWSYAKGSAKAIRAYAPLDRELHRIADALRDASRRAFWRPWAILSDGWRGRSQEVDVQEADDRPDQARDIEQALDDLAAWALSQLRAQWEYVNSDEAIADAMEANGYTFDASGKRRD